MSDPAPQPDGPPGPRAQLLLSPRSRLALLLVLLCAAAVSMLVYEPQQLLTHGFPGHLSGVGAAVLFGGAYGVFTAAFVPRPVLNLAAGAVFGAQAGTASALAGTVLGASIAFGLGRFLGQDALRPMLRARWLTMADRQLSDHGFRSTLVLRLMPGVPFAASNYAAGVSRLRWPGFLCATTLGSVPNTAAYVVAGSSARSPTSPVFLISFGFIALSGLVGALIAWRKRAHLRGTPATTRRDGAGAPDGTALHTALPEDPLPGGPGGGTASPRWATEGGRAAAPRVVVREADHDSNGAAGDADGSPDPREVCPTEP